jgi:hypothetical protein
MRSVLGKMTWSPSAMRPSFWAVVRSDCENSDGTQLVDKLVIYFFPIWFLWARLFTCIYKSYAKGTAKELRSAKKMQQWWQRKGNELVNSNSPTIPLIKHPGEGTWAAMWRKKWKR